MALGGTGQRSCDGGGRSRAAGRESYGLGNGGAGLGGEFVCGALPGQHFCKHALAFFAPFRFVRGGGGEALILAFKGGLLHP